MPTASCVVRSGCHATAVTGEPAPIVMSSDAPRGSHSFTVQSSDPEATHDPAAFHWTANTLPQWSVRAAVDLDAAPERSHTFTVASHDADAAALVARHTDTPDATLWCSPSVDASLRMRLLDDGSSTCAWQAGTTR